MVQVHHVQTRPWQGIHEIHVSLRCFVFFFAIPCLSLEALMILDVSFSHRLHLAWCHQAQELLPEEQRERLAQHQALDPETQQNAAKRSKTQQNAAKRSKTQRQLTDRHLLLFARGWLGVGSWDLVGWPSWPSWPRQMLRNGQPKRRTRPKLLAPFLSSARRSSVRHQLVVLVKFLSKKTRYRKTKKYAFHEHE